jgi:hypothetical protein
MQYAEFMSLQAPLPNLVCRINWGIRYDLLAQFLYLSRRITLSLYSDAAILIPKFSARSRQ